MCIIRLIKINSMKIRRMDVIDSCKELLEDSQTNADVRNSFEQGILLYQRDVACQKL